MIFVAGYGWSHVSIINFSFSWRLYNNLISGHVRFWVVYVKCFRIFFLILAWKLFFISNQFSPFSDSSLLHFFKIITFFLLVWRCGGGWGGGESRPDRADALPAQPAPSFCCSSFRPHGSACKKYFLVFCPFLLYIQESLPKFTNQSFSIITFQTDFIFAFSLQLEYR